MSFVMPNDKFDSTDEEIEKFILKELEEKKQNVLKKIKEKEQDYLIFKYKNNFYLSPFKQYLKYKRKKTQYRELYNQNKLKYYFTINRELVWKYFRKRLLSKLISAVLFSSGMYFFYATGADKKLLTFMKNFYRKIVNIFKRK